MMPGNRKPASQRKTEEPLSLHPLTPEAAVKKAMGVPLVNSPRKDGQKKR